jgi:hypothetical protein
MINGILVERTIDDVVPALKTNSEGLNKILKDLVEAYKKQQDEREKWKKVRPFVKSRSLRGISTAFHAIPMLT